MKILRTVFEALRAAAVDVGRRPLFSILAVAAMALALSVLALFLVASRGARAAYAHLAAEAAVEVYLRPGSDEGLVADLQRRLQADPGVRQVVRIGPEQAMAEFKRLYPDLRDVEELLGDNPLPASLRVTPRDPDAAALVPLVRTARSHAATLSVRYDREWLDALARSGAALRAAGALGVAVLLLSALVTIGAVVRLALDDRIDEVRLLRLAGAPVSFVLTPVLLAGALLGGFGGALALVLVGAAGRVLAGVVAGTPLAVLEAAGPATRLPPSTAIVLLALAALAGAVTALLSTGRAALR